MLRQELDPSSNQIRYYAKISDIAVINRQRKSMEGSQIKELADDIAAHGLYHPVVVRRPHEKDAGREGTCPLVLMGGGRRLAAHVLLGRDEIEVRLFDHLSPIEARIAELHENIKRVDLKWDEEAAARAEIDELLKRLNPTSTLAARAEAVGVSTAQLSKDISLVKALKADPSLKDSGSKGSALRKVEFKETIKERLTLAERNRTVGSTDLRQKLFTADAISFIKSLDRASVDMVFSDLPYGIDYFEAAPGSLKGEYDDNAEDAKSLIYNLVPEFVRVVKPSGWIVLFMCYEWHHWLQELLLNACVTHGAYRGSITDKGCAGAGGTTDRSGECKYLRPELPPSIWTRRGRGNYGHWPELHAANRYEMIVVCNGGNAKYAKKPVENVLDFPPMEGERLHSMQKPHDLCRELIERHTVLGEKVLDVTMGSGAHLAAAASLHRDFLGCDNNADNLPNALTLVGQHFNKNLHDSVQRGRQGSQG